MNIKRVLSVTGCAVGGVLIGFFANKLNSVFGIIAFALGIFLISLCAYSASDNDKK